MREIVGVICLLLVAAGCSAAPPSGGGEKSPYLAWKNGPSADPSFFPIAVWLQDPDRAEDYRAIGINTYVGLWDGPTEEQLARLRKAGIRVFCDQNEVGLRHLDDPTIAGWMHGDEPDNYQSKPAGQEGYDPAIPPSRIIADYERTRRRDPTRPVMLNLGQGVANDEWVGGSAVLSDYPEYLKGADIISFDIYPMAGSQKPSGLDWLWLVGKGVSRLERWSGGRKVVWNALECTQISNPGHRPTTEQVRSEVWMSLIHGSMGIIYFVHQFEPTFVEAGLLADPEMSAAVKEINRQITELAPVLNSPTVGDGGTATPDNPLVPVDIMVKQHGDSLYLFAVGMRNLPTHAMLTFSQLHKLQQNGEVTVVGEDRTTPCWGGRFEDDFAPYQVHIYKVGLAAPKA
jgi:hypothetical protein